MPTRRGWMLALGAALAGVAGRLLGVRELFATAAAGEGVLVAALAYVWARPLRLRGERRLSPDRVPAGGTTHVELTVTNTGGTASPVVTLADGRRTGMRLAPLGRQGSSTATYSFTPHQRGLMALGPLRARLVDPLGVAARSRELAPHSVLTVRPRVEAVDAPPEPPAGQPGRGYLRPTASSQAGDDFHALRPYVDGDDLRRVHWPTTARRDDLFIREDARPRPRETVVALDLRAGVHDPDTLEGAVSAAASVIVAAAEDDGLVRLVTTGGIDSATAGGNTHVELLLDCLASVRVDAASDLHALAGLVGAYLEGASIVVVTSSSIGNELAAITRLGGSANTVTVLKVEPGQELAATWNRLVARGLVTMGVTGSR